MNNGHTPGPWKRAEGSQQIYAGRLHVATAHYAGQPPVDYDEAKANATLIVAAPELLEALILNWEHTDDAGRTFYCNCPRFKRLSDDSRDDPDKLHATGCREARAAIAKAKEGEL